MSIDSVTGRDLQTKLVTENYPFNFVFLSMLSDEIIDSIVNIEQTKRGSVADAVDVVFTNMAHDSERIGQAFISGGTSGEYYCLTMKVTTNIGAVRTCTGVLLVKNIC